MEFDSSSWSILRNSRSQIDVLQNRLLKIFKNFTRKHLWCSLFLVNFIKKRLQHRFFQVKFAKFLWTLFYRTPPVAAFIFCKDSVDISYENSHTHTRKLNVVAAYLFIKYNFILVCGMFFSDWWDTYIFFLVCAFEPAQWWKYHGRLILTTSECYRIFSVFFTLKLAIMENSRYCIN